MNKKSLAKRLIYPSILTGREVKSRKKIKETLVMLNREVANTGETEHQLKEAFKPSSA